ncbi:DUF2388 domain-containing protein [Pseudomonas sp. M5A4_2d]|uniref:DUF2388 domain-containing protein n=1 Tax=Pseudomonas fluorescens TaxID=294 RepID=UPI001C85BBA7|nr:DUF2388 domain-containing protein [Pseudomonas fluorescens]MBX7276278.1 DUF2388 domain-containing protein [Pseudomonas sp. ERGC3:01]QZC93506.1 DUF2388 domain-containing protein [Pseudomonas sp. ERGC3:05]UXV22039.1 DUF2388 domain-containing protein [Pseudomonas fluorescens]
MNLSKTLCALLLAGSACTAHATSFVMTTDFLVSLSMSATKGTSSSFKDDKIVQAAREDAESFVASDGQIRGVRLESALMHIRERLPEQTFSDMQLAQAIAVL